MSKKYKGMVKKKKLGKILIILGIVIVVLSIATIFIVRAIRKNVDFSSYKVYKVSEVTYGDVDTVINGSGSLTPIKKETVTLSMEKIELTSEVTPIEPGIEKNLKYEISEVNYIAGDKATSGETLITLKDDLNNLYAYKAEYDCIILDSSLTENQVLTMGSTLFTIMSVDGFNMSIAVDEYDIALVELGQEVVFSINALNEDYTGTITNISYNGSSSNGSTGYQIITTMDYNEGIYPGMTASAEIVVESSGEGLLVPVSSIITSGDENYIYVASGDYEIGDEFTEDELNVSKLTKVYVDITKSDGSYALIDTDELQEGDLIFIVTMTSNVDSSQNNNESGNGRFPGGGFNGGDFNFGDFGDFGNFPGGFPGMQG